MFPNATSGFRLFPHKIIGVPFCLPCGVILAVAHWLGPEIGIYSPSCLAPGLQDLASPICSVDPATVETNMVLVQVVGLPPSELCQRLQAVSAEEVAQTGHAVRVLLFPWTEQSVRTVWHRDVSTQDTELALRKWEFVLRQLRS